MCQPEPNWLLKHWFLLFRDWQIWILWVRNNYEDLQSQKYFILLFKYKGRSYNYAVFDQEKSCFDKYLQPLWLYEELTKWQAPSCPGSSIDGFYLSSQQPFWCTEQLRKKFLGNVTLLLCKRWAIICYCFEHQHGRLVTWLKTMLFNN